MMPTDLKRSRLTHARYERRAEIAMAVFAKSWRRE